MNKKLLNIKEAAEYLGLKVGRLKYDTSLGRLPSIKVGSTTFYPKEELDRWIESKLSRGAI